MSELSRKLKQRQQPTRKKIILCNNKWSSRLKASFYPNKQNFCFLPSLVVISRDLFKLCYLTMTIICLTIYSRPCLKEIKMKKRDEFRSIAIFPCKLRVLPQHIFNSRDPIVVGVVVEGGIVKEGTPIVIPSKSVSAVFLKLKNVFDCNYYLWCQLFVPLINSVERGWSKRVNPPYSLIPRVMSYF